MTPPPPPPPPTEVSCSYRSELKMTKITNTAAVVCQNPPPPPPPPPPGVHLLQQYHAVTDQTSTVRCARILLPCNNIMTVRPQYNATTMAEALSSSWLANVQVYHSSDLSITSALWLEVCLNPASQQVCCGTAATLYIIVYIYTYII